MKHSALHSNAVRSALCFITLFSALVAIGCAGFQGNQLSDLGQLQPVEVPLAEEVEFRMEWKVNGKPVSGVKKEQLKKQETIAMEIIAESGLFEAVYTEDDERTKEKPMPLLKYSVNNHGNEVLASLSGFITGFTFGLIPGVAVDHWTLDAELTYPGGEMAWTGTYEDKVTGVIWLPMVVVMFGEHNVFAVSQSVVKNMYRHPLQDIRESRTLDTPHVKENVMTTPPAR